jgi:hypothetical protein
MSELSGEPAPPSKKDWALPSWQKIGKFVANVFQLERSVEALKEQNKDLRTEVARLRQVDEQAGQLKTIMHLIDTTVRDRTAMQAEQAAVRIVGQLLALRDERPSQGEG